MFARIDLKTWFGFAAWGLDISERVERQEGFEPSFSAWQAGVLPLNYSRILERPAGIEPVVFCLEGSSSAIELRTR